MKRILIIILIVVFVVLVAIFGSKQGLRKLSLLGSLFTAEFQDKQQKEAQPKGIAPQGVAEKPRVPEKHSGKETKQIEKRAAKPDESPAPGSPSSEPKMTLRGEPEKPSQKKLTQLDYDTIKCNYTSFSVPDSNSRLQEITVEVRGWKLESVEKLRTGARHWDSIEDAEVDMSVIDGVIVGTDSASTKGKTDAAGRFVTHWRSKAGKALFSYGVLVEVKVPGWENPVFCSNSPSFLDY